MDITNVRVRKVDSSGKLKAVASIIIDDEFVVHDIKIIDGQNGLFIAMPSRKKSDGDYCDVAHPLTTETRNRITKAIFEKYESLDSLQEENPYPDKSDSGTVSADESDRETISSDESSGEIQSSDESIESEE